MKLSEERVNYLIQLEKKILIDSIVLNAYTINQSFPYNLRFELTSEDDEDFAFLWVINQSSKARIKLSLHYQENETYVGLLRIDFNASGHHNPEKATESLPSKFLPYIGKTFKESEPHVHYHVNDYKTLAWAIPLSDICFIPENILDTSDLNYNLADAIHSFAKIINLKTEIFINKII